MRGTVLGLPFALLLIGVAKGEPGNDSSGAAVVPIPPQQAVAWTAPASKLSPVVVEAIAQLFQDGLPDPRGCEYREIEIAERKDWKFKTHGWVLPGSGAQKYGISWNGVVYPLASVGAPVDLVKEIDAIPINLRRFRGYGVGWPMSDDLSSNITVGALPIHVAFLLRLGKGEQAAAMWRAGYADAGDQKIPDPYAEMAEEWLDRDYNRAVQAYLHHDDATALAICRQVTPIVARVKEHVRAKGMAEPWPERMYGTHLWQLPVLQADLERRVEEKPFTPTIESGQPASGPERIDALIHDLEQSYAEQDMNPGETEISEDPTVQALVKEGYPAVEPLLKCLTEDNRLTRARYTHGMAYGGPIVPVYEAAYKALFRILNVNFPLYENESQDYRVKKDPRAMSAEERAALAAKIKPGWEKAKSVGLAESAYLTLMNDNATPEDWFHAIDDILQPVDGSRTRYALTPASGGYTCSPDDGFVARGVLLHLKSNPTVSELIIKRFEQLVQGKPDEKLDLSQLSKMLLALAAWDGKAHLADLGRLGKELDARFFRDMDARNPVVNVDLSARRLQLGDATALDDYVGYLRQLSLEDLKGCYALGHEVDLGILWHYPDDTGVRQEAAALFNGKDAPLVPIPNSLIASPLLGIPAFRAEVLRGLGDKSEAGTAKVRAGVVDYVFSATHATGGESPGTGPNEPYPPKPGDEITFRLCDNYAYKLAQIPGFPDCKLYWPESARDAAVKHCKAMLAQYGDALRGEPGDPFDTLAPMYEPVIAKLRIKPLDHPATAEDVKAGRALFTLPGEVRIWKMPSYPLSAAWQAEEVRIEGKWERYFGIFRDGVPTKVPAREMSFTDDFYNGAPVTKWIKGTLIGPEDIDRKEVTMQFSRRLFVPPGAPVPVRIDVCNDNGEDQVVPAEMMAPPDSAPRLPAGVTLTVSFSPKVPPVIHRYSDPEFDFGTFEKVALRDVAVAPPSTQVTTLSPAQKLTVWKSDLRDYFDLSRTGTYHAKASFHVPGQAPASTKEFTFYISPKGSDGAAGAEGN